MKELFRQTFGQSPTHLFSAPGRTELSGNHTDHQRGCVMAAAVNLETLAWVAENDARVIRVQSEGYPMCQVNLDELEVRPEEFNTTTSLIRGIAARFNQLGCQVRGFDACVTSTVLPGSGLSSSAAFEVLIGTICNHLFFESRCTPVEIAQIGQYAENVFFGKPCGLMDQTASSVGNIIGIDFEDAQSPKVQKIDFDFENSGYTLCIIDSGANHADLTDEYAAITQELKAICRVFGKEVLREVPEEEFYSRIVEARAAGGDRAVLRAIHIYDENKRVARQLAALKKRDFDTFLSLVTESGESSWMYLQNVIPCGRSAQQEVAFALALARHHLKGRGACRVHGGGFAGTIQAFVPRDMAEEFTRSMDAVLGQGACHLLSIRPEGGVLVETF